MSAPRKLVLLGIATLCAVSLRAQGNYYLSRIDTLPKVSNILGTSELAIPVNRQDVKAIGRGKTYIANGRVFNGMMYNPALLARGWYGFDVLNVQLGVPTTTVDAATYLRDHGDQVESGDYVRTIQAGVDEFNTSTTAPQKVSALQKIRDGLAFPRDLLNSVIGTASDPMRHGASLVPAMSFQAGNFGFTIYSTVRSDFQIVQSSTLDQILNLNVPASLDQPGEVAQAIRSLMGILGTITDPTGDLRMDEALPRIHAVSYMDIVGALGYAYTLTPELNIGANLKIVNRRFSVKDVAYNNADGMEEELVRDLETNTTGATVDLGATYQFNERTSFGLVLQNVLPLQELQSNASYRYTVTQPDYDRNPVTHQPIVDGQGDTAIVGHVQEVEVSSPYTLSLPFIASAGASYVLTEDWDVSADLIDIFGQDDRIQTGFDRLRLGSEYRLNALGDLLGVAFRLGFADSHPTLGLGLNIFRALQIDGALAYDSYVKENAYYVQVKLGW